MRWTEMNFRHAQWNRGYRYFATWDRLGMWANGAGKLRAWLVERYGPERIPFYGPLPREMVGREHFWWSSPSLSSYPNPDWTIDRDKRRIYVTKELMLLLTLMNKT